MTAVEIVAFHQLNPREPHDGWWECRCGECFSPEHVLAALKAAGYAVVELPEPAEVTVLKNAWWLGGDVTATVGSGRVRCELEDHRLSSVEARELAAVLLAAADAAERAE